MKIASGLVLLGFCGSCAKMPRHSDCLLEVLFGKSASSPTKVCSLYNVVLWRPLHRSVCVVRNIDVIRDN